MKLSDYLILAGIAILLVLAARYAIKHRHDACGGDCSSCPYHQNCDKKEKK